MEALWQDLRYGVRQLGRQRGLTLAAVLSLGLGIGANTAIFSLIDTLFFNPLPGADGERVLALYRTFQPPGQAAVAPAGSALLPVSYRNFSDLRTESRSFESMAAAGFASFNLASGGEPEQIAGSFVTANFFEVLGLNPAAGRFFRPDEDSTRGTHPVAVLAHSLWQRRFGGDPGLIGGEIRLNGRSFVVVGVAPPGFQGVDTLAASQAWVPTAMAQALINSPGLFGQLLDHRGVRMFNMYGRLAVGVTPAQAQRELDTLADRLARAHPQWNRNRGIHSMPLLEARLNPAIRGAAVTAGAVLMGAVALVLAIACANVANLLLARALGRSGEIATRLALGASRRRLVRQFLTEGVLLWALGGLTGWLLAGWGQPLLWSFRPPFLPEDAVSMSLDKRVLGFSLSLTLLTGLGFGLLPALRASRTNLVAALRLRNGAGDTGGPGLRQYLVGGQVALSLVALVMAGFFLRSLDNARRIDPGYETGRLALLSLDTATRGFTLERSRAFQRALVETVEAIPGVRAAALASHPPLSIAGSRRVQIPEAEELAGPDGLYVTVSSVSPSYLDVMGIELVEGRGFDAMDRAGGRQVAIVNQTMARRFWPDRSALGGRFRYPGEDAPLEIVGVARDVKYSTLGETAPPYIYRPLDQEFAAAVTLHMRTAAAAGVLIQPALDAVRNLDPELAVSEPAVMDDVLRASLWGPRAAASLLGAFAMVALMLAATGIYGVVAQIVQQRRREMGIRIALGAGAASVRALVVRLGMLPVALGMLAGGAIAASCLHLSGSLLYGLDGSEPAVYVAAALALALVALAACLVPARQACRVDPMRALRE
jgi:predicted permease